jgi:hypothetical protein
MSNMLFAPEHMTLLIIDIGDSKMFCFAETCTQTSRPICFSDSISLAGAAPVPLSVTSLRTSGGKVVLEADA